MIGKHLCQMEKVKSALHAVAKIQRKHTNKLNYFI
jgi:hypothetical protein